MNVLAVGSTKYVEILPSSFTWSLKIFVNVGFANSKSSAVCGTPLTVIVISSPGQLSAIDAVKTGLDNRTLVSDFATLTQPSELVT